MKRSMWMFFLAFVMTTAAVAFSAQSLFSKVKVGGCNTVCRSDADCTSPTCPFCEPFYSPRAGAVASALCKSF